MKDGTSSFRVRISMTLQTIIFESVLSRIVFHWHWTPEASPLGEFIEILLFVQNSFTWCFYSIFSHEMSIVVGNMKFAMNFVDAFINLLNTNRLLFCEICIRPTKRDDRKEFIAMGSDWRVVSGGIRAWIYQKLKRVTTCAAVEAQIGEGGFSVAEGGHVDESWRGKWRHQKCLREAVLSQQKHTWATS